MSFMTPELEQKYVELKKIIRATVALWSPFLAVLILPWWPMLQVRYSAKKHWQ